MRSTISEIIKSAFGNCVLMQKTPQFNFLIFDDIEKINRADWHTACGEKSIFSSFDYMLSLQRGSEANMHHRYVMLCENDLPVALACFQVINLSGLSLSKMLSENLFQNAVLKMIPVSDEQLFGRNGQPKALLICGNFFATGELGIMANHDENISKVISEFDHILRLVEDSLPDNLKLNATMIKDFANTGNFTNHLLKNNYISFELDPDMIVKIAASWKTFDDYLDALSSKYRVRAKSALVKSEAVISKAFDEKQILANLSLIDSLTNSVYEKAPVRLAKVSSQYYYELKRNLKEKCVIKAYYYQNEMVALSTAVINGKKYCAHLIGIDYSKNKMLCLYQRILYDYIEEAINQKCDILNLGRDALEIKSTVGAEPVALTLYIKFASAFANFLASPFIKLTQQREWKQRKPFREKQEKELIAVKL